MSGQLMSVLQGMFDALGQQDPEKMLGHFSREPQGIDEISREWMRGRDALEAYLRGLLPQVQDVRSELKDFHEVVMGDIGLATFWLEQDYTFEGKQHHISAPSSAVLAREDGQWKVVIFHSIPLPD
jgi:uncharacterized protein (TIGR02246 family)